MKQKFPLLSLAALTLMCVQVSLFACRMPLDDGTGSFCCIRCNVSTREPQRAPLQHPNQLNALQKNRISVLTKQIIGNNKK